MHAYPPSSSWYRRIAFHFSALPSRVRQNLPGISSPRHFIAQPGFHLRLPSQFRYSLFFRNKSFYSKPLSDRRLSRQEWNPALRAVRGRESGCAFLRDGRPSSVIRRIFTVGCLLSAVLLVLLATTAHAQDPRSELIMLINGLRANYGLPPYSVDPGLMAMAQEHSSYQASIHQSTHLHSNGLAPPALGVIENVAGGTYGYVTPYDVVYSIWVDPGHLHTMIGYPSGAIGVGVADDGVTTYYTLELRPSGAALSSPQAAGTAQANYTPIPLVALVTVTPRADGSLVHPVGYGQTLWAIADAYGVTIDQLRAWNNLDPDTSEIYAGQMLLVRPSGLVPTAPTPSAATPAGATFTPTRSPPPTASTITPTAVATSSPALDATATSPGSTTPLVGGKSISGTLLPVIGGLFILGGILLILAARSRRR